MDVHWQEPEDASKPLYQHPNVVSFPHTGRLPTCQMILAARPLWIYCRGQAGDLLEELMVGATPHL